MNRACILTSISQWTISNKEALKEQISNKESLRRTVFIEHHIVHLTSYIVHAITSYIVLHIVHFLHLLNTL